jgi:hypothetical protein
MTNKTIAGIFLIDIRLLSSSHYLSQINHTLFSFYQKFPEAYLTISIFGEDITMWKHFEKVNKIPILEPMPSFSKTKLFDSVIQILNRLDPLFEIYDITKTFCCIASLSKDTSSTQYSLNDFLEVIEQRQKKGWQISFIPHK